MTAKGRDTAWNSRNRARKVTIILIMSKCGRFYHSPEAILGASVIGAIRLDGRETGPGWRNGQPARLRGLRSACAGIDSPELIEIRIRIFPRTFARKL